MSDPDDFLTRWSRRKRQGGDVAMPSNAAPSESTPEPATPSDEAAAARAAAGDAEAAPADPGFDLATLPPVEAITSDTDIRSFLAPGVPVELRIAALRRAWVADPKVRDFVGLADYDWDFHTPGALPGFGPLTMTDELRREVLRIVSGWQADPVSQIADQPSSQCQSAAAAADSSPIAAPDMRPAAVEPSPTPNRSQAVMPQAAEVITQRSEVYVASQLEPPSQQQLPVVRKRIHGGALPE